VDGNNCQVNFWRCRKVQGWQRDVWRFFYRNRLKVLPWVVLDQDRVVLQTLPAEVRNQEFLYEHDVGMARVRRMRETRTREQAAARVALQAA